MIGCLSRFNYLTRIQSQFPSRTILNQHMSTNTEKFHNASPKLPLLYYKASKRAMESINHRVFYANWIFVFAAYDFFTTFVDF